MDDKTMEFIDVVNKTGMKKLCQERIKRQHVLGVMIETKECVNVGLNSGNHDLLGNDYWCRQQKMYLVRDGPVSSGCNCYVRD